MRYAGRRSGQQSRGQDEEFSVEPLAREEEKSTRRSQESSGNVVADLAKSFMEAQTKMAVAGNSGADKAVLAMLEKISLQLEDLRQPPATSRNVEASAGSPQQEQAAAPKGGTEGTKDLAALFSQLLQSDIGGKAQAGGSQAESTTASALGGKGQDGGKNGVNPKQEQDRKQQATAATAAQALAQAQYELANELESSLEKLKQVIGESEKLADKISNLLGQENSQSST